MFIIACFWQYKLRINNYQLLSPSFSYKTTIFHSHGPIKFWDLIYNCKINEIESTELNLKLSINSFWASNDKIKNLGWIQKIELFEGIKLLINQYKNEEIRE